MTCHFVVSVPYCRLCDCKRIYVDLSKNKQKTCPLLIIPLGVIFVRLKHAHCNVIYLEEETRRL